jgi:hypothetical protein
MPEAFNAMHRLELPCKAQLAAVACNTELNPVPPEVLEETWMNDQPQTRRPYGVTEMPCCASWTVSILRTGNNARRPCHALQRGKNDRIPPYAKGAAEAFRPAPRR